METVLNTEMEIGESTENVFVLETEASTETGCLEAILDSPETDVVNVDNTVSVAFIFVLGIIAGLLVFNQLSKGWKL